jgi:two-component system phosphate regulon sensor histidine kinase PhoR
VADESGRVELGVEDRGVGIPAAALPRIFERYRRVPHPDTVEVRGLGLGLALVKSLVEAQGGRIRVESEPGVGSRFIVSLPIA